jgi:hypothetical protein
VANLNYITKIELIVIAGILLFALYIAYSLDLFRKG